MWRQEEKSTSDRAELFRPAGSFLSKLQRGLQGTLWEGMGLEPLHDKGLAHLHIRLLGSGQLLRIPKQSQLDLAPKAHLAYEATCFRVVSQSGVTPVLRHVLPVCDALPKGALIVDAIEGRPARLPGDLPAICRSLAAIHRVPTTSEDGAALYAPQDPLRSMIDEINRQALHLSTLAASTETLDLLASQLEWARLTPFSQERPSCSLITFDAHPGNFLIDEYGKAWMVDLEKCRISYPGFDLAHATLYTSTTWDVDSCSVLSVEDIARAYLEWEEGAIHRRQHRAWHVPLRRLMWLWSMTWCAKWLALSSAKKQNAGAEQDCSDTNNASALDDHVRERTRHYLDPSVIRRVVKEFDELSGIFHEQSKY